MKRQCGTWTRGRSLVSFSPPSTNQNPGELGWTRCQTYCSTSRMRSRQSGLGKKNLSYFTGEISAAFSVSSKKYDQSSPLFFIRPCSTDTDDSGKHGPQSAPNTVSTRFPAPVVISPMNQHSGVDSFLGKGNQSLPRLILPSWSEIALHLLAEYAYASLRVTPAAPLRYRSSPPQSTAESRLVDPSMSHL
ncbi:hypothetical protein ARMGADRAFT_1087976 [Armillaria gallica]|uniref:Uncharacterized protein n=1 Tax=Armillaria gallica TaxID=47427 RepID=A0A2H3D6W0_ARMGA|nr:hypothetical protein ARMGADRAFT_1087976 [Armillaria gallica]